MDINWSLMQNTLINTSFALLFITLIIYWVNLIIKKSTLLSYTSKIITIFINLCLSTILTLRWLQSGYFPLSNLYESLIFLAWSLTLIQLIVEVQNNSRLIALYYQRK